MCMVKVWLFVVCDVIMNLMMVFVMLVWLLMGCVVCVLFFFVLGWKNVCMLG